MSEEFLKTKEEIIDWLGKYGVKNYIINNDLTVDVNNGVNISLLDLEMIPVQFGNVNGCFNCSKNKLTTLIGCPQTVRDEFLCNNNLLTDLFGSPKSVGGDFNCNINKLTSLKGCPEKIGKGFMCMFNDLTNLEFCPRIVGEGFRCNCNKLNTLEYCPDSVGGEFSCLDNAQLSEFQFIYNFAQIYSEHRRLLSEIEMFKLEDKFYNSDTKRKFKL